MGVQVAFGILTHCFVQWPLHILCFLPPSSTFIESLPSFDSFFYQMFRCILGLRSFNDLNEPLNHKQASLLLTDKRIGLVIYIVTIALEVYLGN